MQRSPPVPWRFCQQVDCRLTCCVHSLLPMSWQFPFISSAPVAPCNRNNHAVTAEGLKCHPNCHSGYRLLLVHFVPAFCSFILHKSPRAGATQSALEYTVLKPVPGSGSRAKCAHFRGSSYAKHVSSWFQPWATLWPTCHMLVPASLLQSVDCSTECKNSIFHCTIGCNKYKSSLASGASPQTPPLPPRPPPPAWVHAAHRHGMVSPRKVWLQRPCSSLVLVPEEVVEPASGRYE